MRKAAIIQSSYIPWRGYFDIINDVDVFVFLDDVQMTKRDWRSRNKIKSARGTEWLTVPTLGGRHQRICEVRNADDGWQHRHYKSLLNNYRKAPYFDDFNWLLEWLYHQPHDMLSPFNQRATRLIADYLGIRTEFVSSTELEILGTKDERLISICQAVGATAYLSGPAAQAYIANENFALANIALDYKDYAGYPEYPQQFGPFEPAVSILDLLFNCGSRAAEYIWGWRQDQTTKRNNL